jgi:3-isopropylmalate dehydrogenase
VRYEEAARSIEAAVAKAIGEGRATRDVGGKLGTIAAGAAIAEILQAG